MRSLILIIISYIVCILIKNLLKDYKNLKNQRDP